MVSLQQRHKLICQSFRQSHLLADVIFGILILASIWIIFSFPSPVEADQSFILHSFSWDQFPAFESGALSNLITGIFHRLFFASPVTPDFLNSWIRTIALILYSVPAYALARLKLKETASILVFLGLLFSSRMPFLWLSSELFAGCFLSLAFFAMGARWKAVWIGLILALFALTKPDNILTATVVLAWYCFEQYPNLSSIKWASIGYFLPLFSLLFPGWLNSSGKNESVGRSFESFSQHYAALFANHQLMSSPPNPWTHSHEYVSADFPTAKTVFQAIRINPRAYLDFVILSFVAGLINLIRLVKLLILVVPARLAHKRPSSEFERLLMVSLIGTLPWFVLSTPHVRYFARFYPAFLIFVISCIEQQLASNSCKSIERWAWKILIFLSLAVQVFILIRYIPNVLSGEFRLWWFPD